MADTIARLGLELDASPFEAGIRTLDSFSAAAQRVAPALEQLVRAGDPVSRVLADFGRTLSTTGPQAAQNTRLLAELGQYLNALAPAGQQATAGLRQAAAATEQAAQAEAALSASVQGGTAAIVQQAAAARELYEPLARIAAARAAAAAAPSPPVAVGAPSVAAGEPRPQAATTVVESAGVQQATAANTALARSAATATEAERGLAAAAGGAGSSAASSSAALARLGATGAEVAGSSRSLNAAFAQFEPLATQQLRIVQALAAGYINAETAAQAWVLAERGAFEASGRFGNAFVSGTGAAGRALTNISFQFQDFIGQVSYGTPLIQAFAQQAPQALVGFGPWAAVLGVGAAAVGGLVALLPYLTGETTNAAKAAKEQQQATEDLLKALDVETGSLAELRGSLSGLSTAQQSLVGGDLRASLDADTKAFDEASKKAADYAQQLGQGASFGARFREMLAAVAAPEAGAAIGAGPGTGQQAEDIKRITDAAQVLQNRMQALQAGVGSFDQVAEALRQLGAAAQQSGQEADQSAPQWDKVSASQAAAAKSSAEHRAEIENEIDKLAPLASASEAARQSMLLHTAQVHQFLEAMGQKGAITEFDEQILHQAEVAKGATAAIRELNTAQQALLALDKSQRIRTSGLPDADQKADDFLTRELASIQGGEFQRGQQTKQAELTIAFKGDTSEAQKALKLLQDSAVDVGAKFEEQEKAIRAFGAAHSDAYTGEQIQRAVDAARKSADELIATQHKTALEAALVSAGFKPEEAQKQTAAIFQGNQGLDDRAKTVKAIADLEKSRDALAGKGTQFGRDLVTVNQEITQQQQHLQEIDARRAQTAQGHADAIANQRNALLAQEGPEAALAAAEEKIARARKEGVLRNDAQVAQASAGAYERFFKGVEQQAAAAAAGGTQVERVTAQIDAVQQAMAAHTETRAAGEKEVNRLTEERQRLLDREQDQLDKQDETIEKGIATAQSQLAQLRARGGAEIGTAVEQARRAAEEQVQLPTPEQMDAPGGGALFDRRLEKRQLRGDLAEQNVLQQQYNSLLQQVRTPLQAYNDNLAKNDELLARGKLTLDEYARAVVGIVTPQQRFDEEMDKIGAEMATVNRLYEQGNISLARRNELLRGGVAAQGRAAAAQRQANVQQDFDIGEAGSGASTGNQITAGLDAGLAQLTEQYGNLSKQIATGFVDAFNTAADAFTQFLTTGKADWRGMMVSILDDLTKLAVEYTMISALRAAVFGFGGGGGGGGGAGTLATFARTDSLISAYGHTGGMVEHLTDKRPVDPAWFIGAPRAHAGLNLANDDVPIVARRGERVLSPAETAAYSRGGGSGGTSISMTIHVDARGGTDPSALQAAATRGAQAGAAQALARVNRNPALRQKVTGR